ncbi:MAG: rhomboid family intramembrane serine protease [Candidatus Woesearchaeota archaeon]
MFKLKLPKTATYTLLTTTLLIFILQIILGNDFTEFFLLVPSDILVRPWILITSMFLHANFTHLFFNMYVLLIFGPLIEGRIGMKRFYLMYLCSGIISAIGYSLISTNPALGASGAMMGLLGVTIMLMPNLRVLFLFFIPMSLRTAGIIFAMIDLLGVFNPGSGIAHWAHLFGLGAGLIYGWYLVKQKQKFENAFNTLKKYVKDNNINIKVEPRKEKKSSKEVRDADFTYSEQIQLTDEDIDNYLKNGRL